MICTRPGQARFRHLTAPGRPISCTWGSPGPPRPRNHSRTTHRLRGCPGLYGSLIQVSSTCGTTTPPDAPWNLPGFPSPAPGARPRPRAAGPVPAGWVGFVRFAPSRPGAPHTRRDGCPGDRPAAPAPSTPEGRSRPHPRRHLNGRCRLTQIDLASPARTPGASATSNPMDSHEAGRNRETVFRHLRASWATPPKKLDHGPTPHNLGDYTRSTSELLRLRKGSRAGRRPSTQAAEQH